MCASLPSPSPPSLLVPSNHSISHHSACSANEALQKREPQGMVPGVRVISYLQGHKLLDAERLIITIGNVRDMKSISS